MTHAQNTFADDPLLQRLSDSLPRGWSVVIQDSELIISRHDSVWARHDNKISMSIIDAEKISKRTDEETQELFKKDGWRAESKLIYSLEPKWNRWTMAKAWAKNDSISSLISALKAQYDLQNIYYKSKDGDEFRARTDDEKERVRQYWQERNMLEAQYVKTPEYNSGKYSLFEKSATGFGDAYTDIWPPEASAECYKIRALLLEILGRGVFR